MSLERINKMLARSLVTKMIESGDTNDNSALADLNFKELEALYTKTLEEVEASPDMRRELVESLKKYQAEHGNLHELYSAEDIAADPELQAIMGI